MEIVEYLEGGLAFGAGVLKILLECISAFCVAVGLMRTIRLAFSLPRRSRPTLFVEIRLTFGQWLALALEFQLGADILATTISPTTEALIKLAAIALIRTFLNYFLNKELETEADLKEKSKQPYPSMTVEET